jgi:serine/threonine protein phosphatase PrpC
MKTIQLIKSHIGGRAEQQDSSNSERIQTKIGRILLIADGMGGHNGGSIASKKAIEVILDTISNCDPSLSAEDCLVNSICKANEAIFNTAQEDPALKGMGTTIVALLLTDESAILCHVGDSRIYHIRDNSIQFKTQDHSWVGEMVKNGLLSEEEAQHHEKSNIITRALGISSTVLVDLKTITDLKEEDLFILCSDGITGALDDTTLVQVLNSKEHLEDSLDHIISVVDNLGQSKGGGHDNMTIGVLKIKKLERNQANLKTRIIPEQENESSPEKSGLNKKLLVTLLFLALLLSFISFYFGYQSGTVSNSPNIYKQTEQKQREVNMPVLDKTEKDLPTKKEAVVKDTSQQAPQLPNEITITPVEVNSAVSKTE